MTYAVKYLAGAYHVADGNANRAVHYYAAGYYYAAKQRGLPTRVAGSALTAFATTSLAVAPTESVSSSSSLYSGRPDYH